jgi:hypothetical protein
MIKNNEEEFKFLRTMKFANNKNFFKEKFPNASESCLDLMGKMLRLNG